jgi:hypothetical protein
LAGRFACERADLIAGIGQVPARQRGDHSRQASDASRLIWGDEGNGRAELLDSYRGLPD